MHENQMGDLIWIGNTLYPRGAVIFVAAIVFLAIVGAFTYFTREN